MGETRRKGPWKGGTGGRWRRKVNKETKKSRSQMTRKKEGKKDLRGVRF